MENQKITISELRKVKGIGDKTIDAIQEMIDSKSDNVYISEYDKGIHLNRNNIYQGDCLELMNGIEDKSVDMILCDLPYGTTQNKWDSVIDFEKLWKQYKRIIKDNGAIVLFGQGAFSANLTNSNYCMWKYDLIWNKVLASGFLNANRMPLRNHEDIHVFYKSLPTYNPQMIKGRINNSKGKMLNNINNNYGQYNKVDNREKLGDMKYPKSILEFAKPHPSVSQHPTQKPVELLEYLIKTYTNEGQVVLDNTMGSGSTCVACINTNRDYIGIEMDEEYFKIAKDRINSIK